MANWYKELLKIDETDKIIKIAVQENEDRYDGKVRKGYYDSIAEAKELLDYDFDDDFGGEEGPCFTAWTENRVYFPGCYDGSEWIAYVPRNPIPEAQTHIGGG